jgi:hypothetical protein
MMNNDQSISFLSISPICRTCGGRSTTVVICNTFMCICADCGTISNVERENLIMAVKTITVCDRPGCIKEFSDNSGHRFMAISIPMNTPENVELVSTIRSMVADKLLVDWDIDNGCDATYKEHLIDRLRYDKTVRWGRSKRKDYEILAAVTETEEGEPFPGEQF